MVNAKTNHARPVEMSWVPVRDREGRVHMEARWHDRRSAQRTSTELRSA